MDLKAELQKEGRWTFEMRKHHSLRRVSFSFGTRFPGHTPSSCFLFLLPGLLVASDC